MSITQEIYETFDDEWEGRGVFREVSKGFDKVWHEGVIPNLKQNEIGN